MRTIFLDVDGVINFQKCEAKAPNGCIGVQDALVRKLKRIVDETGAIIILCSTWRKDWERDPEESTETGKYLTRKLKRHGLHISGKTPDIGSGERGREIREWIEKNCEGIVLEGWCVLDDEVFQDYEECGILPHLVQTSIETGLTDEDVENAIELIINKK